MRKSLIGLTILPFLADGASAAQRLCDAHLEKITAGALALPSFAGVLTSFPASLLLNAGPSTFSSILRRQRRPTWVKRV
jgi:hypothetical protein